MQHDMNESAVPGAELETKISDERALLGAAAGLPSIARNRNPARIADPGRRRRDGRSALLTARCASYAGPAEMLVLTVKQVSVG
jgi:hypothetical protein